MKSARMINKMPITKRIGRRSSEEPLREADRVGSIIREETATCVSQ